MTEVVGVVPAAGYATRLQPLEGSKELLRVAGRPIIDYLVERMRVGGCTRIRVVTRPEKVDVVAYGQSIGAEVILASPMSVSESFQLGMDGLTPDDLVLIGFPDTIWEPTTGFQALRPAVESGADVALGLFRIRAGDLTRSDVVEFDAEGRVVGIHVKPAEPPSDWIWGCAVARVSAMSGLSQTEWPGGYFDQLCRVGREVHSVSLSDVWLDVGTPEALAHAEKELAPKRFQGSH